MPSHSFDVITVRSVAKSVKYSVDVGETRIDDPATMLKAAHCNCETIAADNNYFHQYKPTKVGKVHFVLVGRNSSLP